ncbi:hypothetical protein B1H58_19545 [Pantoea alhagi]|uniref:Uncharacterized protein n=1 Tax=Pantoea alhagi TaxID=1891675 RepID=A0A1W6BAB8_9GAMM|nr:hypothetical protein B1H58_19545 [Pantoea alhagi]
MLVKLRNEIKQTGEYQPGLCPPDGNQMTQHRARSGADGNNGYVIQQLIPRTVGGRSIRSMDGDT